MLVHDALNNGMKARDTMKPAEQIMVDLTDYQAAF